MKVVSDRRIVQRVQDAAFAALLGAVGVAEIWVPLPSVMGEGSRELSTVVVVLTAAALTFRRVLPLTTLVVIVSGFLVLVSGGEVLILFWGGFVPMLVALYSVARHGAGRRAMYGGLIGAATWVYLDLTVDVLQSPGEIVFHWTVSVVTWAAGRGLAVMERRADASMRRAIEAEVASAERTMAAIIDERTRIARELHDIVAHAVSVMVVQAGAAEQVVDEDPGHVRKALQTIRTTGNGALAEMRRAVAMLRDTEELGQLRPQPGIEALPALIEDARGGGLDVSLTTEGEQRPLPAGLDLAAYRIAQEALTNVRRHAAASRVDVVLRYGDAEVQLEVRDDGTGVPAEAAGFDGHGLIGMRERAALYGGRLETASTDGAGFTVRAVLPVVPA